MPRTIYPKSLVLCVAVASVALLGAQGASAQGFRLRPAPIPIRPPVFEPAPRFPSYRPLNGPGQFQQQGNNNGPGVPDEVVWTIPLIGGVAVCFAIGWYVVRGARSPRAVVKNTSAWELIETEDQVWSPRQVTAWVQETAQILTDRARQDESLALDCLVQRARKTFLHVQEAWQNREFTPVKELLSSNMFARYAEMIDQMHKDGTVNRLDDLTIERLEIVAARLPEDVDQQEFAAIITFTARSTLRTIDTDTVVGGSTEMRPFQEMWTFARHGTNWLLAGVRSSHHSVPDHASEPCVTN